MTEKMTPSIKRALKRLGFEVDKDGNIKVPKKEKTKQKKLDGFL